MERVTKISGSITTEQFLYREIKITALLFLQGLTLDEAVQALKKDNLYQFGTERNIRRIARVCYRRLEALESREAVEELLNGPQDGSRLINLYALARTNGLVWKFLTDLVGEKFVNHDRKLSKVDVNSFISNLQATNEAASKWKGSTPSHVVQVLMKILVEAGYLDSIKAETMNNVFPEDLLKNLIEIHNEQEILPAFHLKR